jgi:hypothetical protein
LERTPSLDVILASKQFVCVIVNISDEIKGLIKDEKLNAIKKL